MEQIHVPIQDPSAVGEARRRAAALGARLGLDEAVCGTLALAVTEAATNVLTHGGGGALLVRPLAAPPGVEVIAIDRGPGIANVATSLRDGYSTAGTPGYGLGTLTRMTSGLDLFTQPGRGTVLRFAVHAKGPAGPAAFEAGVVCVAKPGQDVSGDGWCVTGSGATLVALVVDGLGHGVHAAEAAAIAERTLRARPEAGAEGHVRALHEALRPTRGAAAAVCTFTPAGASFCGIGNIRAFVRETGSTKHLVSHPGTLGHQMRKAQPWAFHCGADGLVVMHSDGLGTHWTPGDYPGLEARHPSVIAGVAFRDHWRQNDDATVLVLKPGGPR